MDDTKIGDSDTITLDSNVSLSISDLDSLLSSSITATADTMSSMAQLDYSNIAITGGSGYTLSSGTASNATWTTTGTGTGAIGPQVYTISPNTVSYGDLSIVGGGLYTQSSGKMSLKGENADIDINGKSMLQWMQKVEERLNILTPNPELEKEWDDLRRLGERYRKLEKKCKEKAEMWKKLKSMPKPEIN